MKRSSLGLSGRAVPMPTGTLVGVIGRAPSVGARTRVWVMSERGDVARGFGTALQRLGLVRAEDTGC